MFFYPSFIGLSTIITYIITFGLISCQLIPPGEKRGVVLQRGYASYFLHYFRLDTPYHRALIAGEWCGTCKLRQFGTIKNLCS